MPALYEEITLSRGERCLPRVPDDTRSAAFASSIGWRCCSALAVFYLATVLLNRLLTPLVRAAGGALFESRRRFARHALPRRPGCCCWRVVDRWLLASLPLVAAVATVPGPTPPALVTIVAVTWLLILMNGEVEALHPSPAFPDAERPRRGRCCESGAAGCDVLVIFVALLASLRHFGIDPTPALAGLGVGGIAVALAAQKTLENVIAGASLIFDQAVRVGDFLKMGEIVGTVDHIGLRSTRIRTLDRTIVSVPNSQIANTSLETLSARDKFWFHPVVGLRYETTPEQLRRSSTASAAAQSQRRRPRIVRVRFFRLGAFSLDVEVFAYVLRGTGTTSWRSRKSCCST